jgi:hypothetical protein
MEVRGKVLAKAGNGKGFKVEGQEGWFNAGDAVVPYLAKIEKGTEVIVTFEKKGVAKNVTKIVKAGTETPKEEHQPTKSSTGFECEDCGKELKDGKFKKCFMCNKKAPKTEGNKISRKEPSYTQSPERSAQIQRGNALNAAGRLLSGRPEDPETLAEMAIVVAQKFLDWLRAE